MLYPAQRIVVKERKSSIATTHRAIHLLAKEELRKRCSAIIESRQFYNEASTIYANALELQRTLAERNPALGPLEIEQMAFTIMRRNVREIYQEIYQYTHADWQSHKNQIVISSHTAQKEIELQYLNSVCCTIL